MSDPRQILLVTGMSGAGKTTTLKALEDLNFEAVDNIPLSLIPNLAAPVWAPEDQSDPDSATKALAIGVDIRTRDFDAKTFRRAVEQLKQQQGVKLSVVRVDCTDEALQQRYSETRHRHPLAQDRPLLDGIHLERTLIQPLADLADIVIDTTGRSPGELKSHLAALFEASGAVQASGEINAGVGAMKVFVTSFAYSHGLPREADLVFDVRFLRNPHYDPALKDLSGRDPAVGKMIETDPDFARFMDHLDGLIEVLLPRFEQEGKSYLTLAVGCTGGRHRSVFVAERLAARLETTGRVVRVSHRELDAITPAGAPSALRAGSD
ncbi:MAG: RNase adapter RapZ [Rhodospirillaceae bacterium]|nr:RNase adapter RapZ [Rhodospirillaceae bacterium]